MASEVAVALNAVRAINMLMTLATELGASYQELARIMEEAEAQNREVSVDDLESLQVSSDRARKSLDKAIREARK